MKNALKTFSCCDLTMKFTTASYSIKTKRYNCDNIDNLLKEKKNAILNTSRLMKNLTLRTWYSTICHAQRTHWKNVKKTRTHITLLRRKFPERNFLISLCSHRESASDWQLSGKFEGNSNFGTFPRQVWTFQYVFIRIIRQRRVTNDSQRPSSSYFFLPSSHLFRFIFQIYIFFFDWKNRRIHMSSEFISNENESKFIKFQMNFISRFLYS